MTILTEPLASVAATGLAVPARPATTTALVRGGLVELRPLGAHEASLVQAVFDGMSAGSVKQRFLAPMPRLTGTMVSRLTAVDGVQHVAWVALLEEAPVGIARYVVTDSGAADIAFEVVDACQRRGVGTVLLDAVTTVAHARGVQRIQACALAENTGSLTLLGKVGLRLAATGGVAEGESPLRLMEPAAVDRDVVLRLAG